MNKPGAWVETDGHIGPDASDEAMKQRLHTGEPLKTGKKREVKNEVKK